MSWRLRQYYLSRLCIRGRSSTAWRRADPLFRLTRAKCNPVYISKAFGTGPQKGLWKSGDAEPHTEIDASQNGSSISIDHDLPLLRCLELLRTNKSASNGDEPWSFLDRRIRLQGTIRSIRKHKQGAFAHLSDGTCFEPVQLVLGPDLASTLQTGSKVQVTGTWKSSPARGQSHELVADQIDVLGAADIENYPIQKKFQSVEFLRSLPHLRLRLPANAVQARFRSQCLAFVTRFLSSTDYSSGHFVQVQPPVITSSDCEGAGEVFTVLPAADTTISSSKQSNDASTKKPSFFKTAKYLSVSSQLHLEAYAAALGNVWALSPTFRAEKSDTSRHLAEFYMLEAEMSFVFSLHTLTGLVEHLIKSLVSDDAVRDQWQELILALRASHGSSSQAGKVEDLEGRWEVLQGEPWKQVSYSVCMARLVDAAAKNPSLFQHQPIPGSSLHLEHERWIVEHVSRNRPIFVTDYPKAIKPFYMAPSELSRTRVGLARESGEDVTNDDAAEVGEVEKDDRSKAGREDGHQRQESVACFDLLFPFGAGEIAGGSLREHRLEHLIQNLRQNGMLRSGIDDTASSASSSSSSSPSSHNSCTIPHKDDSNLFPSTSTAYPPPPPPATASATTSATASTRPTYPHLTPYESLGPLKWYVDLRRHGTVPHGGFGIGWDRLLAYLTGVENLKDMVAFPRSYGKAEC